MLLLNLLLLITFSLLSLLFQLYLSFFMLKPKEVHLLLSTLPNFFASLKSSIIFLYDLNRVVSLSFFCNFCTFLQSTFLFLIFLILLMQVLCQIGSIYTLPTTFDLLYEANSHFNSIEYRFSINNLLLRHISVMKLQEFLIKDLVSVLKFTNQFVPKETRKVNFKRLEYSFLL